jgi:predicted enzyme related to lactoylglutathione lyase
MPKFVADYFELPVPDAPAARDFFATAFGWNHADYGPSYQELKAGDLLMGLNADPAERALPPVIGIRTDNLAAAELAIVAAGGVITRPAYDYPGGRRLFFSTPDGHELMVYQPGE